MAAFEAAGDPDALPARRRAVAAAQDLLQRRLVQGRGSRRSTTRMLAEGLESPYAEWLANWKPRRSGRPTTTIACGDLLRDA